MTDKLLEKYTKDGSIDFDALDEDIIWHLRGISGISHRLREIENKLYSIDDNVDKLLQVIIFLLTVIIAIIVGIVFSIK